MKNILNTRVRKLDHTHWMLKVSEMHPSWVRHDNSAPHYYTADVYVFERAEMRRIDVYIMRKTI